MISSDEFRERGPCLAARRLPAEKYRAKASTFPIWHCKSTHTSEMVSQLRATTVHCSYFNNNTGGCLVGLEGVSDSLLSRKLCTRHAPLIEPLVEMVLAAGRSGCSDAWRVTYVQGEPNRLEEKREAPREARPCTEHQANQCPGDGRDHAWLPDVHCVGQCSAEKPTAPD